MDDEWLQDSDFVADKDDGGSPTDDSGGDDSDASDSGDENEASCLLYFCLHTQEWWTEYWARSLMMNFQKPVKKEPAKESSSHKAAAAAKKRPKDGVEDASKKKKQKKKKDPNAPKKAMSAFMHYSQMEREVGIKWVGTGNINVIPVILICCLHFFVLLITECEES